MTAAVIVWLVYIFIAVQAKYYYRARDYYRLGAVAILAIVNLMVLVQSIKIIAFKGDIISTGKVIIIPTILEKSSQKYMLGSYFNNQRIVLPYKDIVLVKRISRRDQPVSYFKDTMELTCRVGNKMHAYRLPGGYCQDPAMLAILIERLYNQGAIIDMSHVIRKSR
ncbi:MAG: hypothetical protein AAF770_00935 [Bacteroidota bacterium]